MSQWLRKDKVCEGITDELTGHPIDQQAVEGVRKERAQLEGGRRHLCEESREEHCSRVMVVAHPCGTLLSNRLVRQLFRSLLDTLVGHSCGGLLKAPTKRVLNQVGLSQTSQPTLQLHMRKVRRSFVFLNTTSKANHQSDGVDLRLGPTEDLHAMLFRFIVLLYVVQLQYHVGPT